MKPDRPGMAPAASFVFIIHRFAAGASRWPLKQPFETIAASQGKSSSSARSWETPALAANTCFSSPIAAQESTSAGPCASSAEACCH